MSLRTLRALLARCGLGVLVGALALRAMLPVGYMLADAGAGSPLALCPVQSAELIQVLASADPHWHHRHGHHHGAAASGVDKSDGGCGFALALGAALPPVVALPQILAAPAALPAAPGFILAAHHRRAASARGPPALV